jgi:GNAT superfamily N-acetyltransferase
VPEVRIADAGDTSLVAGIAARGFFDDPVMSWVFRDASTRLAQLQLAFHGLLDTYLPDAGTVHILDDACASLWRAPGFDYASQHDRDGRASAGEGAEGSDSDTGEEPPSDLFPKDVLKRLMIVGAAMAEHHPTSPHWYLNVVSTLPERQGQGLGALTLRPVLTVCDDGTHPAYLESSNPRNIPFYERQGFVLTGEIPLPDGPSLYPMWREPAGSRAGASPGRAVSAEPV